MMNKENSEKIYINNVKLKCKHCDHDRFYSGQYLLNTVGLTLLGIDWLNRTADVFICSQCGFLHWFLAFPSEIRKGSVPCEEAPDDLSEPCQCVSCGAEIPEGVDKCPSCGWSYKDVIKEE